MGRKKSRKKKGKKKPKLKEVEVDTSEAPDIEKIISTSNPKGKFDPDDKKTVPISENVVSLEDYDTNISVTEIEWETEKKYRPLTKKVKAVEGTKGLSEERDVTYVNIEKKDSKDRIIENKFLLLKNVIPERHHFTQELIRRLRSIPSNIRKLDSEKSKKYSLHLHDLRFILKSFCPPIPIGKASFTEMRKNILEDPRVKGKEPKDITFIGEKCKDKSFKADITIFEELKADILNCVECRLEIHDYKKNNGKLENTKKR